MKDYQKRVEQEKADLNLKIIALSAFLFTDSLASKSSKEELDLVLNQLYTMMEYSKILEQRIATY